MAEVQVGHATPVKLRLALLQSLRAGAFETFSSKQLSKYNGEMKLALEFGSKTSITRKLIISRMGTRIPRRKSQHLRYAYASEQS